MSRKICSQFGAFILEHDLGLIKMRSLYSNQEIILGLRRAGLLVWLSMFSKMMKNVPAQFLVKWFCLKVRMPRDSSSDSWFASENVRIMRFFALSCAIVCRALLTSFPLSLPSCFVLPAWLTVCWEKSRWEFSKTVTRNKLLNQWFFVESKVRVLNRKECHTRRSSFQFGRGKEGLFINIKILKKYLHSCAET